MASKTYFVRSTFSVLLLIPIWMTTWFVLSLHPLQAQTVSSSIIEERERYLASIYPPDVMNCEVCRARLGLPPRVPMNATVLRNAIADHAETLPEPAGNIATAPAVQPKIGIPTRPPLAGLPPSPIIDVSNLTLIERQRLLNAIEVPSDQRVLSFRILDAPKPQDRSKATDAALPTQAALPTAPPSPSTTNLVPVVPK
jgi:hypothetical protein